MPRCELCLKTGRPDSVTRKNQPLKVAVQGIRKANPRFPAFAPMEKELGSHHSCHSSRKKNWRNWELKTFLHPSDNWGYRTKSHHLEIWRVTAEIRLGSRERATGTVNWYEHLNGHFDELLEVECRLGGEWKLPGYSRLRGTSTLLGVSCLQEFYQILAVKSPENFPQQLWQWERKSNYSEYTQGVLCSKAPSPGEKILPVPHLRCKNGVSPSRAPSSHPFSSEGSRVELDTVMKITAPRHRATENWNSITKSHYLPLFCALLLHQQGSSVTVCYSWKRGKVQTVQERVLPET